MVCSNCGESAPGDYCPSCGQSQDDPRISILEWLKQALDEVLSLNAKVPRTVAALFLRPGKLTREWRDGRRIAYVRPIRLFLSMLVVFFGLLFGLGLDTSPSESETDDAPQEVVTEEGSTTTRSATELVTEDYGKTPEELAQRRRLRVILSVVFFLFLPVLALALKLLYAGSGHYLVEHLVFALHWISFMTLPLLLGVSLETRGEALFGTREPVIVEVLGWALVAWVAAYTVIALRRTYDSSWISSGARTLGVGVVLAGTITAGAFPLGYAIRWLGDQVSLNPLKAQEDRAYDLIRQAREAREEGDSARLDLLLPGTIEAFYRIAEEQEDRHNRYHLAEAQLWAGQPFAALATAQEMVRRMPEDARARGLAGWAACRAGRDSVAAAHYRMYWEKYAEAGRDSLVENHGHEGDLNRFAGEAEAVVAGEGCQDGGG